jgi:two-component system chemotaxis response regulator CheY
LQAIYTEQIEAENEPLPVEVIRGHKVLEKRQGDSLRIAQLQLLMILLVDDNCDAIDLMTIVLEMEGHEVLVARDGKEGLLRARSGRPALIITDINMPNVDGIRMIKQLRKTKGLRGKPILAVTAYGMAYAEKAMKAGASRIIVKPFTPELLLKQVEELLWG